MHDWERIRAEHGPIVWTTVCRIIRNRHDAQDCYQEVFLEAYRKADRATVTNLAGLLRWLATRRALDVVRSQRRRQVPQEPLEIASEPATLRSTAAESAELAELMERVRNELSVLPSKQAQAFWICCVEQFSYVEAAEQMQVSQRHIGVLVHRARAALRKSLCDLRTGRQDR